MSLTRAEAFLLCEVVGQEYLSDDSRLTPPQRLVQAVDDDWSDSNVFLLDYWASGDRPEIPLLIAKLEQLTSRQAQALISATKRFWKLSENGAEENEALDQVCLI